MDFDFSDEQKLLRDQLRRFLQDKCGRAVVRRVLDSDDQYSSDVWRGLINLGLTGIGIPEQLGGIGAGHLELCVTAEELGRAVAPVPFSTNLYLTAEVLKSAGTEEQLERFLPQLASGESIGTIALFERAGKKVSSPVTATVCGNRLTGTKVSVPDGSSADFAIVVARSTDSGEEGLYLASLTDVTVVRTSTSSVDPTRKVAELTFSVTPVELLGEIGRAQEYLSDALNKAAVFFAFEQLGGAERALENAVEYAKERAAFGRQIGSFQAIKHTLADMYVAVQLARSNCYYGAWALSENQSQLPLAAATARVSATRAYQFCAKENIQIHGGFGFTWEADCHLHYRRSAYLSLVLGNQAEWESKLVTQLMQQNQFK